MHEDKGTHSIYSLNENLALREHCQDLEFFYSVYSRIQIESGNLFDASPKSPYSVQTEENTDQNQLQIRIFLTLFTLIIPGNFSELVAMFHFKRLMGFAILQIYAPVSAIVCVSWISLWIRKSATPGRVGKGNFVGKGNSKVF